MILAPPYRFLINIGSIQFPPRVLACQMESSLDRSRNQNPRHWRQGGESNVHLIESQLEIAGNPRSRKPELLECWAGTMYPGAQVGWWAALLRFLLPTRHQYLSIWPHNICRYADATLTITLAGSRASQPEEIAPFLTA